MNVKNCVWHLSVRIWALLAGLVIFGFALDSVRGRVAELERQAIIQTEFDKEVQLRLDADLERVTKRVDK
jgi:hypothetical protein